MGSGRQILATTRPDMSVLSYPNPDFVSRAVETAANYASAPYPCHRRHSVAALSSAARQAKLFPGAPYPPPWPTLTPGCRQRLGCGLGPARLGHQLPRRLAVQLGLVGVQQPALRQGGAHTCGAGVARVPSSCYLTQATRHGGRRRIRELGCHGGRFSCTRLPYFSMGSIAVASRNQ